MDNPADTPASKNNSMNANATAFLCLIGLNAPWAQAADLELGEYLASECTTCHRTGDEANGIPPLGGWPAQLLVNVLEQYRDGERQNAVMQSVVGNLTQADMEALGAWFEQVDISR